MELRKAPEECFKSLEQRRLKAARLLEQGIHQSEVARRDRQSVSRSAWQVEQADRAGLKRAGGAGRKPKLCTSHLKRIEQGPEVGVPHQPVDRQTGSEQECGIRYTSTHVWRLLKQL